MIITRFHDLEKIELKLEFLTPAFLGGADGNAELRSAPFKNLLRQWWRISNGHLHTKELGKKEGELFGVAGAKETDSHRSLVTLYITGIDYKDFFEHSYNPKHNQHSIPRYNSSMTQIIKPFIYLGYGPVPTNGPWKRFIKPGKRINVNIYFPHKIKAEIEKILYLAHHFGAVGSRSRNGWGAFSLESDDIDFDKLFSIKTNNLENAFCEKRYPWTLGKDEKGLLCWETANRFDNWESAMVEMAKIYATLRYNTKEMKNINARAILGYPLRNATISEKTDRIPKQLRMTFNKINGKLAGIFYHLPFKLPVDLISNIQEIELWKAIHRYLDSSAQLRRCSSIIQGVQS